VNSVVAAGLYFGSLIHTVRTKEIVRETYGYSLADKKYRDEIIEHSTRNLMFGILHSPQTSPPIGTHS
jgi:hypothetical protein